ncbi:MAG: Uncharacterised protein [Polaribacter sejongensis]|nr:MAG: Uncharacterised protein [Polaribacter sejongensis]
MKIIHQLINSDSGKIMILTLNGKNLISETRKKEKTRTTTKEFSSNEDALKNFNKKEWEALKKGFILTNANVKLGQPTLHKFIGGGYTGCLSFEQTPNGICIYKNDGQEERLIDKLMFIDNLGVLLKQIELPQPLAWNIQYRIETNSLLLDIDHFIYEFDIENNRFSNLGNKKSSVDSFVSVGKDRTAFACLGKLSIVDDLNTIIWSSNYDKQTIKGNTPFCGQLSRDGKLLAFHNKAGEIQIIDAISGKLLNKIIGDFLMIFQMEFTENNQALVIREHYGTWGIRYFELSNYKEIKIDSLEIPEYTKEVSAFCLNQDQSKLVLVQRTTAYVFDFNTKNILHSFKIEHVVKTCNIKFVGEKLGVRTDYGCFSLYNV